MTELRTIIERLEYDRTHLRVVMQSGLDEAVSADLWAVSNDIDAALSHLQAMQWVSVEERLPPRHKNVWCKNRNGVEFEGRICYGLHSPFFTFPKGWKDASDTAPDWLDVVAWRPFVPGDQT